MSENGPLNGPGSSFPLSDRNKSRISLGSGADSPDNRWSDVVPPNSALTFAAVWDPKDGMVTFSGALLLDSSDESEYSSGAITPPEIFDDDVSQVVTIEQASESGENTPTIETFQDVFKAFLHRVPRNSRYHKHKRSNTLASSTLDGLDVYSRDPVFSTNPLLSVKHQYFSQRFGKLDEELPLKARNESPDISSESDHVSDEGFFEESSIFKGRTELKSHWSVSTTSTSTYVEVPHISETVPESRSRTPHPLWIADMDQPVFSPTTPPNTPRRRLKKRRPTGFSSPSHGSSSSEQTSPVSPSPTPISPSGSLRSKRSRRLARAPTDDSWVCIEITPFITQRVVDET
ncbi:hypothetical protein M405DRAFT_828668 [Rhizopogon salebrosus TDB-379]|nr:hypothetical protein M405DRAFT_828668 [Rhizopogon salebrosus TDB-379]